MFGKKGQGTTEYLIILAVIIVIALVVVGVMGWFPGVAFGITEQQSRAYWQSAAPMSITQYNIDGTNADLIVRNQTVDEIGVTDITLDGVSVGSATDLNIVAGSQGTYTGTGVTCTTGEAYSYDIVITYDVVDGLTGAKQTGSKPLIGTCS